MSASFTLPGLVSSILAIFAVVAGPPAPRADNYSEQEQWVLAEVSNDRVADLTKQYTVPEKRRLGAPFLEQLVTGMLRECSPQRRGVRIIGAEFQEAIDLQFCEIKWPVWLDNCTFHGDFICTGGSFTKLLSFEGSHFHKRWIMKNSHINLLNINKVVFEAAVSLHAARIGGTIFGNRLTSKAREDGCDFNGVVIGDDCVLNGARFESAADFVCANIGGQLQCENVNFNSPLGANFTRLNVNDVATFSKSHFAGPVRFRRAAIGKNFLFNDVTAEGTTHAEGEYPVEFRGLNVGDDGFFARTRFNGRADFTDSHFGMLEIQDVVWAPKDGLMLSGAKFARISASREYKDRDTWSTLQPWLAAATPFSFSPYKELSDCFWNQGDSDLADEVYIVGRRDERKGILSGIPWLWSLVIDVLLGYGRQPWRAAIPSVVMVLVGWLVFRPSIMEPKDPQRPDPISTYSAFWFSVGSFLPIIDLLVGNWRPQTSHYVARNYVRVHILAGWLLVPLALASVTGLVK